PVARHPADRTWHRLVQGMMVRRSQRRALDDLIGPVIPEPVLAGLVALDDRVACSCGVVARVLGWRRVTAADVAAERAAPKVKPPAVFCDAFRTARAARRHCRIDIHPVGLLCG